MQQFDEGDEVTVVWPDREPRDGTVVARDRRCGEPRYTVLYDDDESADPRVPAEYVEKRGQIAMEVA